MDLSLPGLLAWLRAPRAPRLPHGEAIAQFHRSHPRYTFLSSLPLGAHVLDFGAGEGSLANYVTWPGADRSDLSLYAYSLEDRPGFARYAGREIGRFEDGPPDFGGRSFDAVFACHVVEHLADRAELVRFLRERTSPQARLYIEWPSPHTVDLPPVTALREAGFDVVISNFHDDATHRAVPARDELAGALGEAGFAVEVAGFVRAPFWEEELLAHARRTRDPVELCCAFWSHTCWSQYLLLARR